MFIPEGMVCGYEVRTSCEVSLSVTSAAVSNIEIQYSAVSIYTTTTYKNTNNLSPTALPYWYIAVDHSSPSS